jgi:myo-inositol-1(or 4)-monophosphatase
MSAKDYLQFLELLGYEARSLALKYFRSSFNIVTKEDDTPVTIADREIEKRLRQMIASRFPADAIVGEEEGGTISSGVSWVIDPIDGTKSFVCGLPLFGTLVGVLHHRKPAFGLIEIPALHERWVGNDTLTTMNGNPCEVSRCTSLSDARLCSTDTRMFSGEALDSFKRLVKSVRMTRHGTDSYGYAMLASGHIDLVVEADLKLHDVMALVPVIVGAGGIVTTWNGNPITDKFEGDILAAATPQLHSEAMRILNR